MFGAPLQSWRHRDRREPSLMLDIIVRGGHVIDGTGRPGRDADVGIDGGRIAEVGDLIGIAAERELDAASCLVAPGFVDIHSHSDFTLLVDPRARSAIAQGVTTEIVGNCGHGCAPIRDPKLVKGNIYGYSPLVDLNWTEMDGYLSRLDEAGPAVNVGTLVPHGNLRLAVVGLKDREANRDEIPQMVRLLEESLDAGALGFSTGLEYSTERASGPEELIALCRAARQSGAFHATHTRQRDIGALNAIQEAIDIATAADVPLQVSHIIPRRTGRDDDWQRALQMVDSARGNGLDVTFDAHTRLHSTTNLSTVLPPGEMALHGDALRRRLQDPELRDTVKHYPSLIRSLGAGGWNRAYLLNSPHRQELEGKSFEELAGPDGDPLDVILDLLIAEADDPHVPMIYYHSYEEEWLLGTMSHPLCMVGSDAIDLATDGPLDGTTFLGAYTWAGWFLRRMVRETGSISWEEAINRLTDLPAQRAGLKGRGRLAVGYCADLVVLDAAAVGERGTLQEPNRYGRGIVHVVVNGVLAMESGAFTDLRNGQVLRGGNAA
jgi:N-acyl-D-amino-acid deacylase